MNIQPIELPASLVWYRFDDIQYAPPVDEFDNVCGEGRLVVRLSTFKVIRTTPKGVWLNIGKFVLREARKRYACPTEAEALESFKARKQRQMSIFGARYARAERALKMAEREFAKLTNASGKPLEW